jgi:hypothetical protein
LALGLGSAGKPITGGRLYLGTALRLAVLQISGFTLLEFLERALGHADVTVWTEPVFQIGLVVQVLVAAVAAAFLVLFSRTILALKGRSSRRKERRAPQLFTYFEQVFVPRPPVAVGAGTLRGPPEVS